MKKRWTALILAALLVTGLTACGGGKTGSSVGTAPPSASENPVVPRMGDGSWDDPMSPERMGEAVTGTPVPRVNTDPMQGGTANGMGALGNGYPETQPGRNILDDLGKGVRDTLDDMGDMARDVGQDAKAMLQ